MSATIKLRRDTKANWTANNPVLYLGEPALESDTFQLKVGDGVTAYNSVAYKGNTGSASPTLQYISYGDGSDGALVLSSGITNLQRDMFYSSISWATPFTGQINTNGYKIFVSNYIDFTFAQAGAINWNGTAGGAASGNAGGTQPTAATSNSVGRGQQGGAGMTGGTALGTNGGAGVNSAAPSQGGLGGAGGTGGTGTNGAGGTAGGGGAATYVPFRQLDYDLVQGVTLLQAGAGGGGGAAGGGDGTFSGGGGGSGGNAGGVVAIWAKVIIKTSATPAGVIQSNGGNGGTGGTGTGGNTGGGGAGGGGAGGWVYLVYQTAGGPVLPLIQANGGEGAVGGNGVGTGLGGGGSNGGTAGRITVINSLTNVTNEVSYNVVNTLVKSIGIGNQGGSAGGMTSVIYSL